jgi:hypothetical protein
MSGLWTNDRDTLADGLIKELDWVHAPDLKWAAVRLIATRAVKVLDPDDTELVERVAGRLGMTPAMVRAVIEALRQP